MAAGSNISHEIECRVSFCDLDPMQIVWHGHYFRYFDDARQALLAGQGVDLVECSIKGPYSFPIVRTSTKHLHPLRLADRFRCKATLLEARTRIIVDFEIRLETGGKLCALGRTEQVAVRLPEMKVEMFIPAEIRAALGS